MADLADRVQSVLRQARARPTLLAQAVNALGSLALITILTRSLEPRDFGTYVAVIATYAFANALVGTTMGTRAIQALSSTDASAFALGLRRDVPAMGAAVLAAVGTAAISQDDGTVLAAAGAGMVATLLSELGIAHALGRQEYWRYFALVAGRMTLWAGCALAAALTLPEADRLAAMLLATVASAVIPVGHLLRHRGVQIRRHVDGAVSPVSAIGLTQLALWLLASGDRVILSHFAPVALATYAAVYGLLDRVFRTLATAELHLGLSRAFTEQGRGSTTPVLPGRRQLLVYGVGTVATAIAAPTAVELISGGTYEPPLWMSAALSVAMVLMLVAVPPYVRLLSQDRARIAFGVAVCAAGINIIGNLVLASEYGTTSATVLTLIGYLIWMVGVTSATDRRAPVVAGVESHPS